MVIKPTKSQVLQSRGVFNNASARNAIEFFSSECKRSPRRLHALAIQLYRCFSQNSKMATKTIMGFHKILCRQYFRFNFWDDDVCFFVWIYEMEQLKLKVGGCFALLFDNRWGLICLLRRHSHF